MKLDEIIVEQNRIRIRHHQKTPHKYSVVSFLQIPDCPVLSCAEPDCKLQDRTGTVSIAVVRTVAVLRAGVPAPTLGHLIGRLAGLAVSSEHVALATPELVWLLVVVAGEVRAAVSGVSVDGMSLEKVLRSECFPPGTGEAVNLVYFLPVTPPRLLAGLVLPHTAPHLGVEDERDRAGELEGAPVVALDVFVADILLRVVEHAVGSLALRVSVRGRLLDVDPVPAVHVVREHTLLVVGNLVVEEKTLGTELYVCHSLATDVEEVALLEVSELSVGFRTLKLRAEFSILLG